MCQRDDRERKDKDDRGRYDREKIEEDMINR